MTNTYSVYTRVGKAKPPLLTLLGSSYKSSTGGVSVAKKAMKQLIQIDSRIRKKNLYIRKHNSDSMKVYRASTRKTKPVALMIGNTPVVFKMKPRAKYLRTINDYTILAPR